MADWWLYSELDVTDDAADPRRPRLLFSIDVGRRVGWRGRASELEAPVPPSALLHYHMQPPQVRLSKAPVSLITRLSLTGVSPEDPRPSATIAVREVKPMVYIYAGEGAVWTVSPTRAKSPERA